MDYPLDKLTINILDNHPENKSYDFIREKYLDGTYPIRIVLERSSKNLGFSGGNNYIFKRLLRNSGSPFFFLLNVDTEMEPTCFSQLVEFMRADPDLGMVEAIQKPKEHPKWYDPQTHETGWCSGGGVLIWRDALDQVGLFDDRFFLYCEDVDLSWRMWLKGWKCKINPNASLYHYTESQDTEKDLSTQQYYSMRNGFYMHYKYDSVAGINAHEVLFHETMPKVGDDTLRQVFYRAYADAKRNRSRFFLDRICRWFFSPNQWILFNEFSFERRRPFVDTEDGNRIILEH